MGTPSRGHLVLAVLCTMKTTFNHIAYQQYTGSKPDPHLLITAGIHGDEYEPVLAVLRLIGELEGKISSGTVTLVPVVNQSAFSQASRTGEDGLDLARSCPGKPDGTLTERVADEISTLIRQADYFIDLHTGGNAYRLAPFAGYMLHPSEEVLSRQRMMAQAFNLPIVWGTTPHLEGRTLSVARDAQVPAIYVEYEGGGSSDPQSIEKLIVGCWNVLTHLGMIEDTLPDNEVVYTVEDYRENSGHLQVLHPSPVDGIFEASVRLGDTAIQGQPIGTVYSILGELLSTITTSEEGIVLLLRAIPSVKQGDALGGILPITQPGKIILR